jgi:hypothetical protein
LLSSDDAPSARSSAPRAHAQLPCIRLSLHFTYDFALSAL